MRLEELHPPFGLRIRSGDLEMHPVRMDDIPVLLDLIATGVVSADIPGYPLAGPFALGDDTMARRRSSLRFWWQSWVDATPERWAFPMTVLRGGVVVGVQDILARDFPTIRSAETGSWLGVQHQGKGTGKLMRQVMCTFAFDHLGARELHSGAFHDNHRSLGVSRAVGYEFNGRRLMLRGNGEASEEVLVRLTPDRLVRPEVPVEVDGLGPFLDFLGLAD